MLFFSCVLYVLRPHVNHGGWGGVVLCQPKTERAAKCRSVPLEAKTVARYFVVRSLSINPDAHSRIQENSLIGPALSQLNPFL